jgi:hypothetical protein
MAARTYSSVCIIITDITVKTCIHNALMETLEMHSKF